MSERITLGEPPPTKKGEERQPTPVGIYPGDYVLLTQKEWEKIEALVGSWVPKRIKKLHPVTVTSLCIPDSGPRICPYCGMDFWQHRGMCRMMFADPNDPDAEY
jgi:hypothetical protein